MWPTRGSPPPGRTPRAADRRAVGTDRAHGLRRPVAAQTLAARMRLQAGGRSPPARFRRAHARAARLGYLRELGPVAAGLAIIALAGVLLRTGLTFRENLALADTPRQAVTDELTGLANRRSSYAGARRALRDRDACRPCSCVDLDRFKELNDTLGHQAGDRAARSRCRPADEAVGRRRRSWLGSAATSSPAPGARIGASRGAAPRRTASRRAREPVRCSTACAARRRELGVAGTRSTRPSARAPAPRRRRDVPAKARRQRRRGLRPSDDDHSRERLALAASCGRVGRRRARPPLPAQGDLRPAGSTASRRSCAGTHPERGLRPAGRFRRRSSSVPARARR